MTTKTTGALAPEAEGLPALTAAKIAASFNVWWAANIPNSPVSRDTPARNKAHELRSQLLAIFNSVTGE
jgi:hypothetical protein